MLYSPSKSLKFGRIKNKKLEVVWANFALCSNCVGGSQAQYYSHSYKWSKEGPGPISGVRANKYPRTAS